MTDMSLSELLALPVAHFEDNVSVMFPLQDEADDRIVLGWLSRHAAAVITRVRRWDPGVTGVTFDVARDVTVPLVGRTVVVSRALRMTARYADFMGEAEQRRRATALSRAMVAL